FRSDELLERSVCRRCGFSRSSQRCPVILTDHNSRQVVVEAGSATHWDGVSGDIVDHEHGDSPRRFGVRNFLAEGPRPAVNDRKLPGGAWVNPRATVGVAVEEVERCPRQWRKLAHRGTDCRAVPRRVGKRLADEMLICARTNRYDL